MCLCEFLFPFSRSTSNPLLHHHRPSLSHSHIHRRVSLSPSTPLHSPRAHHLAPSSTFTPSLSSSTTPSATSLVRLLTPYATHETSRPRSHQHDIRRSCPSTGLLFARSDTTLGALVTTMPAPLSRIALAAKQNQIIALQALQAAAASASASSSSSSSSIGGSPPPSSSYVKSSDGVVIAVGAKRGRKFQAYRAPSLVKASPAVVASSSSETSASQLVPLITTSVPHWSAEGSHPLFDLLRQTIRDLLTHQRPIPWCSRHSARQGTRSSAEGASGSKARSSQEACVQSRARTSRRQGTGQEAQEQQPIRYRGRRYSGSCFIRQLEGNARTRQQAKS